MRRIKLTVAYDGTNYVGWQVQPNGKAIEEMLNAALSKLLSEQITVIGASRTDSGVHADGNIAVFDTKSRIPADKFRFAVNEFLPPDIVIEASEEVPLSYHPRKLNSVKTYEYRILNRKLPLPKERNYSYFYYYDLDCAKMDRASKVLLGEHDFKSFCSIRTSVEDTVRRIYSVSCVREGDFIIFRISGSGFLFNMVRIIVGTLVKIGAGIIPESEMGAILEARDRAKAGPRAPAAGLTLKSIVEEKELPDTVCEDNPHWSYRIDYRGVKSFIAGAQPEMRNSPAAEIVIRRADERDYEKLLLRLTKQVSRNGAVFIYLTDETGRLQDGQKAAYFTYSRQPDGRFLTRDPRKLAEPDEENEE